MGRRALVVANWKMNGQKARIASLSESLLAGLTALRVAGSVEHSAKQRSGDTAAAAVESNDGDATVVGVDSSQRIEVVVCPPFPYLAQIQAALQGSAVLLGAQDVFTEDSGAYTGEVSAPMLKDFDCHYVLVGHSERRQLLGETDAQVAAKFAAAQRSGLIPVLCVGETGEERESGRTDTVVAGQVEAVLQQVGADAFRSAVIAYEPVWAIGSGKAATPDIAQAVHALIRATLARHAAEVAAALRILYGGSVNAANAGEFALQQDIDGALVGGASLVAEDFVSICASVNAAR